MNGKLQAKTTSKVLVNKSVLQEVAEIILAFGLGILAVTLHAKLRIPIRIPGHHGLEFMALLIISKQLTNTKFSGSIFSLGAGVMLIIPFLGFKDPYAPIVYMLPGILLDLFFTIGIFKKKTIFITALLGGLAYSLIPVTRAIIMLLTGFVYKNMIAGPWYPIMSFFAFGFAGTLITFGIIKSFKK